MKGSGEAKYQPQSVRKRKFINRCDNTSVILSSADSKLASNELAKK